jgi:hypothetical protein
MSKEDAVRAIVDGVREGDREGWFRSGDKNYKPRIVAAIEASSDVRNAALNLFHRYVTESGQDVAFNEFLDTPVTLYRAGEVAADEAFASFTYDRSMAERHAERTGTPVQSITVRPRDTYGMMQTIAEGEVMVPTALAQQAPEAAQPPVSPETGGEREFVADAEGKPLSLFHGTVEAFDTFEAGEFGFHFGDEVVANP